MERGVGVHEPGARHARAGGRDLHGVVLEDAEAGEERGISLVSAAKMV
jgi:hypothetical protein